MIVIGKEHGNELPAMFECLGSGEIYVLSRSICGKLFQVPIEKFIEHFYLLDGDNEELAIWVNAGGLVAEVKFSHEDLS